MTAAPPELAALHERAAILADLGHIHALLFMGWVAIYLAQSGLVAAGNLNLHKKLGWVAAGWMAAMVLSGFVVTVTMVRNGTVPFFIQPLHYLVYNPVAVCTFAGILFRSMPRPWIGVAPTTSMASSNVGGGCCGCGGWLGAGVCAPKTAIVAQPTIIQLRDALTRAAPNGRSVELNMNPRILIEMMMGTNTRR